MATNGNGESRRWTVNALLVLVGMLVGLISLFIPYVATSSGKVSKDELQGLVQQYSPYVQDKEIISDRIQRLRDDVSDIQTTLSSLNSQATTIALLSAKVDQLRDQIRQLMLESSRTTPH